MKATPARRGAALVAGLVLALPGTALAQGAGDNQYQDPFGSDQGGGGSQQQASSGSGSQGSGSSSSGSSSSGSSSSSAQLSGTPPGMNGATGTGTLPRTGGEPLPLAALGTGL